MTADAQRNDKTENGKPPADAAAEELRTVGDGDAVNAEGPPPAGAPDAGAEPPAEAEADRLRVENAELKDKLMRSLAEAENVRRRTEQDRRNLIRYGVAPLAELLFPVADNLRRALDAASAEGKAQDDHFQSLLEGVAMTERQLAQALEKTGVTRVSPEPGQPFDYRYHQAMTEVTDSPHPPGAVAYVLQDGYTLHDRLLRAAMVAVVSVNAPTAPPASENDGQSGDSGGKEASCG